MCSMLVKPDTIPVQMMTARLMVMNSYLYQFPFPDNTNFSVCGTVDVILSMIPIQWVEKMVTATVEPRNLTIKELVDHLENLMNQDISGQN